MSVRSGVTGRALVFSASAESPDGDADKNLDYYWRVVQILVRTHSEKN